MKIRFEPMGLEVEATPDKSLLTIAQENNIQIRSICKGQVSCGECRVKIIEGENNVPPPTKAELNLIGTTYFIDGRRLSCRANAFGNITVDLTEQLETKEGGSKKIRGFKSKNSSSNESHAVQGTLVLDEGPDLSQPEKPAEQKQNHLDKKNDHPKKAQHDNNHQGHSKNEKSNKNDRHHNHDKSNRQEKNQQGSHQDKSNKNDKSKR